jgi:16S rRNA processing protein RimM
MIDLLQVGAVTSTHGIAGEVKVFPTTDDPNRFKKLKSVLLDTGKGMKELQITQVKFFKNMVILRFKDHNKIEDVMSYKGKALYVTRENAVKLKKNEYFIADLIGLSVYEEDGNLLGTLTDVLQTGANDVYVVKMENGKEVLIPAIHQCILSVEPQEGRMMVHLLEGLLE